MLTRVAFVTSFFLLNLTHGASSSVGLGTNEIPATSALGSKLLSKARRLEDGEEDFTWVADYSIVFAGCHSIVKFAGEGEDAGGDENGINLYSQKLVRFKLCPTNTCGNGSKNQCAYGAEYLIDLNLFVQSYDELRREAKEEACEMVRENCVCQDVDDDEKCEEICYVNAGMEDCIEVEGEEEFQAEMYLECGEMEMANNNGNNNNLQYFVGPKCSDDGSKVHIAVYTDAACTFPADADMYERYNYGAYLPYTEKTGDSLVGFDCISCRQRDENGNNNGDDDIQLLEMCEELYEDSAKCERDLPIDNPNTYSCDYIEDGVFKQSEQFSENNHTAAKVFAWLFALSSIGLAVYAYFLFTKYDRSNVQLGDQNDGKTPVLA